MRYFQSRRVFLQGLSAFFIGNLLQRPVFAGVGVLQGSSADRLKELLPGSWKLQSYTYTSNNMTFSAPDEMEGLVNFTDTGYDVDFSTYISRAGIKRTRTKSESGTFSVNGSRIRLFAEEASEDDEKGEEFLTEVEIDGNVMRLTSNNGSNKEVWEKV